MDPMKKKHFCARKHAFYGSLINVILHRTLLDVYVWVFQVNNAAVSYNEIHQNSVEHADEVIKTNYYGPKSLIEALFPFFSLSRTTTRVLNLSSRLGLLNVSIPSTIIHNCN